MVDFPRPSFEILHLQRQRQRGAGDPLSGTGQQAAVTQLLALNFDSVAVAPTGTGSISFHVYASQQCITAVVVSHLDPEIKRRQRILGAGAAIEAGIGQRDRLLIDAGNPTHPAQTRSHTDTGRAIHPIVSVFRDQADAAFGKLTFVIQGGALLCVTGRDGKTAGEGLSHVAERRAGRCDKTPAQAVFAGDEATKRHTGGGGDGVTEVA
ncbi:hypothetical protein D3C71_1323330 [compost metagenome]